MARKKLTCEVYIEIEGEQLLWYSIDEDGKATYFLPEDKGKAIEQAMLNNIGQRMSRYYSSQD